ncbi:MAG: hypothetical protein M1839_004790 [Geoglossum umbratile]|nr:MAG: hypothetical protein M1839_004790 [Geoglossum umbratile]
MALAIGLFLLALGLTVSSQHTKDIVSRQDPATYSRENFVRRVFHGTAVAGNVLYIDGGEEVVVINGVKTQRPLNQTLSIDLSKSWTNSTPPTVRAIDKGSCPSLNEIILWSDPANDTIYAYGGQLSYSVPWVGGSTVPQEAFWAFKVDGKGGGSWRQLDMSDSPTWVSLTRTTGGLGASSSSAGYNLGGYAGSRTSQKTGIDGFIPIPGLQTYNYTSGAWSNNSALGYSKFGTAQVGGMVHVPSWGPAGLLVIVGGQTSPLTSWSDGGTMVSMSNITVFEPQNQTWYHQTATGDIPTQRDRFCLVGAQGGDNSTYEIFLYGGHVSGGIFGGGNQTDPAVQANAELDQVYVLSLPAFVWIKANYTSKDPRVLQSCHVVGAGGRQLLSVGGIKANFVSLEVSYQDTDPYPFGLKVFDMTAMRWTDGFNVSAEPYAPPDAVARYYSQHGKYPSKWTDSGLGDLISPPNSTSSSTPSQSPAGAAQATPRKSHTGAIVGSVVGGVGALVLIALALGAHFRSTKRRQMSEIDAMRQATRVHELDQATRPAELGSGRFPTELMGKEVEKKAVVIT